MTSRCMPRPQCLQWKDARFSYLKLEKGPDRAAKFAKQDCRSRIGNIVHMLKHSVADPLSFFPLEVSDSRPLYIGSWQ